MIGSDNFSVKTVPFAFSKVSPSSLPCDWDQCVNQQIKITGTGFRSDAKVPALDGLARCEQPNPEGTEIVCKLNEQTMNRSLKVAVRNDLKNLSNLLSIFTKMILKTRFSNTILNYIEVNCCKQLVDSFACVKFNLKAINYQSVRKIIQNIVVGFLFNCQLAKCLSQRIEGCYQL